MNRQDTGRARVRRGSLALLTLTHVTDDLYAGAAPAILPFLVAERHYSYTAVSLIALAGTALSSVAQPVFGVLTDRHRLEWMVWAGMLLAGLGVGLSGVGDSYLVTWLAMAVSGLGIAAYHPEAARSARLAAGGSAQAMSVFAVGGNIGIALAPLYVAAVLGATALAGTPLLALPAVVMAAVVLLSRWRRRARVSGAAAAGRASGTAEPAGRDDWRSFRWLVGVVMSRSIAYTGVVSFLALFLIERFDVSEEVGSAALTTVTGAGVAGTLLGGWLADRIGRVATLRLAFALAPVAFVALLSVPNLAVAFPVLAVLGLACFLPFSVQMTLGQEYLPGRVGTASGVTLGLGIAMGGLFTPVLGVLADAYGLTTALATLLLFFVLPLPLSLPLRDARRDPAPVPDHAATGAG
jgi:MFS transporter, FSR family, fosmidomycin resistance protein